MSDKTKKYLKQLEFVKVREETLKEKLDKLTDEERLQLFNNYCLACGSKDSNCKCWNDE